MTNTTKNGLEKTVPTFRSYAVTEAKCSEINFYVYTNITSCYDFHRSTYATR